MVLQFHVAFSARVHGVGVIAGGPYYCSLSNVLIAEGTCLNTHMRIFKWDISFTCSGSTQKLKFAVYMWSRIWKYHAIALFSTLKLRIIFNRLAPLTHAACVPTRLPPYLCVLPHVQAAACAYRKKSMWTSWCPSPRTLSPLQGRSTTPATWPQPACGSWGKDLSFLPFFNPLFWWCMGFSSFL